MNKANYTYQFAAYSCDTYSSGNYGLCDASTTTSNSSPLDTLANTGYNVLIPVFLGVALVVAGSILLMKRWLRKRKQQALPLGED